MLNPSVGRTVYIYIYIVYKGKIIKSWDPTEKRKGKKKTALRLLERNNGSWMLLQSYRLVRKKKE